MTEYFAKTIADKEDEYKALSPQGQYATYKAIVEYGYEQGEIEQKPNTIKEDIENFVTEWLKAWKETRNKEQL